MEGFNRLLFGWLCISIMTTQVQAKTWTLSDLVEYGMTHSFQTQNAKNQWEISQFQVQNASARFLPSLDLLTDFGYRRGTFPQTDGPSGLFSLTLSEILYDNGVNMVLYDIAKKERSRSQMAYIRDQNQLCLDIFREYSHYSLLTHLLKAQQSHYQMLKQQAQSMENKYRRGEELRINFLRFQAQVQRTQLAQGKTQTDIQKSVEQIKSIVGLTEPTVSISPMAIKDMPQSRDMDAIENILKNHYEYHIATHSKDIHAKQVDLENRNYWPQITLSGSLSYINPNYVSSIPYNQRPFDLSAFITLSYNLWDWGIRRRNVAIAKATMVIANNTIDSHLLTLRTRIEQLFLDIQQQTQDVQLSRELFDLEKENYESISRDWYNGQLTFLDLINAFNNYVTAQEAYYRSFFSLQTFLSEYKYHKGQLYESLVQH